MGWNSSVVLIEGASADQVKQAIPDVFAVTNRFIVGDEALSSALYPNAALGEIPGWVALWTSNVQLLMSEEFLKAVSRGGRAVACVQSSVSTIHGFMVYVKGKHRRTLIRENYEAAADSGDPLPEETAIAWEDDESNVFEVVRRLTGVDVPAWETWNGMMFVIVEPG
jgi:hypothetical protein